MTASPLDRVTLPLIVDAPTVAPWETEDPDLVFDAYRDFVLALASTVGLAWSRRTDAPELLLQVLARKRIRCALFAGEILHVRALPLPSWTETASWTSDPATVRGVALACLPSLLLRVGEVAGAPCAGGCGTSVPIEGLYCERCYLQDE